MKRSVAVTKRKDLFDSSFKKSIDKSWENYIMDGVVVLYFAFRAMSLYENSDLLDRQMEQMQNYMASFPEEKTDVLVQLESVLNNPLTVAYSPEGKIKLLDELTKEIGKILEGSQVVELLMGSEKQKASMQKRNKEMEINDNGSDEKDMDALMNMGLSMREEARLNIISLPGFGEFASTISIGAKYIDMDAPDGTRSIAHLAQSPKFKTLMNKVSGLQLMSLERTYELMNIIAKTLGITDTVDENYINSVLKQYPKQDLRKDHPLGRIGRAMGVILGAWFAIPISVDGTVVSSFSCDGAYCWVFDLDYKANSVVPLVEIVSSPAS